MHTNGEVRTQRRCCCGGFRNQDMKKEGTGEDVWDVKKSGRRDRIEAFVYFNSFF